MKRLVVAFAIGTASLAATAASAGAGPRDNLVAGTGQGVLATQFGAFSSHAHVNARGDATDAHGKTWARFFNTPVGDVLIKGSVFCVDADGNEAIVGSIVEESNTSFVPVGSQVFRKVIDNGQGRSDPPDQTGTVSFFPPLFTQCPLATAPIATSPIVQGNFVVKDGG
jgi:hypothetical protein